VPAAKEYRVRSVRRGRQKHKGGKDEKKMKRQCGAGVKECPNRKNL
jgi:hypothetical protein